MSSIIFLYVFNQSDIHTLAYLYTDPGSGAFLWQLLIASFFGILFYVRSFIRRIAATMSDGRIRKEGAQQVAVERKGSPATNRNRLK